MAVLLTMPLLQLLDQNGNPYAGGTLSFYTPGTLTPATTWKNEAQTVLNTNPVVLDAAGRAQIWGVGAYRVILRDALSNTVWDQVTDSTQGAAAWVSVLDFGAVGNGVTDDTVAVQAALTAQTAYGGAVIVPNAAKLRILGNLTVPPGVSLMGEQPLRAPGGSNTAEPFTQWGASVYLTSTATITLGSGAGLRGLMILRDGIAAPVTATTLTAFAGTAVTLTGDDASVTGCCIFGFAQGLTASGVNRLRLYDLYMDNTANVSISNSQDTTRIEHLHCWPFTTIAFVAGGGAAAALNRSGIAINLSSSSDDTQLDDILIYGFMRGIVLNGSAATIMTNVWIDGGAPPLAGSVGISISGVVAHCNIRNVKMFSQEGGIDCNGAAGSFVEIGQADFAGSSVQGILARGGIVRIGSIAYLSGTANTPALTMVNTVVRCSFEELRIGSAGGGVLSTSGTFTAGQIKYGRIISDDGPAPYVGNPFIAGGASSSPLYAVPSAAALALPFSENVVFVSGTTGLSSILGGWLGRQVTLIFGSPLTVSTGAGINQIALHGTTNWAASAGSTLTVFYDGSLWREIAHMDP